MVNIVTKNSSRRSFLRTAPVAAAAGFALSDTSLFAASAAAQSAVDAGGTFKLLSAQTIQDDIKVLEAEPGTNFLVTEKNFTVMLIIEKAASAKEFEWHEGRDHFLQVLDGTTVYEVGGTPKDGRNVKPGEWLAPTSVGSTALTLKAGDMLVIPRGTPHKRSTMESVCLLLTSPMGTMKA
jgi:mannose-6-phosphate isomerase-like protein (cupin superfamily)